MEIKLPTWCTKDKQEFILENYPKMTHKELVETFNKKYGTEYTYSYFKRKIVPSVYRENGLRVSDLRKGKFKKGHLCKHYKEIGSERWDRYAQEWLIKTSDTSNKKNKGWERKNRVMYERYYGELPEGYAVIFKNGNKNDYSKENLIAVPKNYLREMKVLDMVEDQKLREDMLQVILLTNQIFDVIREKRKEME